jgi:hypothetical protein
MGRVGVTDEFCSFSTSYAREPENRRVELLLENMNAVTAATVAVTCGDIVD